IVFALWLDRGAPRPRATVFFVALSVFALLVLTPWNHLVNVNALPDTFGVVILYHLGTGHAATAVAAVSLAVLAAIVLLRGRSIAALPIVMLALLIGSSAIASDDIADRVSYDQHNLVGRPPDWITRATQAPT